MSTHTYGIVHKVVHSIRPHGPDNTLGRLVTSSANILDDVQVVDRNRTSICIWVARLVYEVLGWLLAAAVDPKALGTFR